MSSSAESPDARHPDGSGRRWPGPWTRRIGDVTLRYLPDAEIELVPTAFRPGSSADDWAARPERLTDDGHLTAGAGSLVVERGGRRLLVDAGFGPDSADRDQTPAHLGAVRSGRLPESLAAAELDPAGVETVAFTHLHPDHLGWATTSAVDDGRSLFPAASWLVGEGELEGEYRSDPSTLAGESERTRSVAAGDEAIPGVHAWPLGGHTSGHVAWVVDAGATTVILFGDAMHSPAQVEQPDWEVAVDVDREAAERSRRALIDELARPGVLGVGIHFADQQCGRVVDGRWAPPM